MVRRASSVVTMHYHGQACRNEAGERVRLSWSGVYAVPGRSSGAGVLCRLAGKKCTPFSAVSAPLAKTTTHTHTHTRAQVTQRYTHRCDYPQAQTSSSPSCVAAACILAGRGQRGNGSLQENHPLLSNMRAALLRGGWGSGGAPAFARWIRHQNVRLGKPSCLWRTVATPVPVSSSGPLPPCKSVQSLSRKIEFRAHLVQTCGEQWQCNCTHEDVCSRMEKSEIIAALAYKSEDPSTIHALPMRTTQYLWALGHVLCGNLPA